jgi:glutaredoxin
VRHVKLFFIILIAAVHGGGMAYGEIYKWVDKNGVQHFGDAPPQKAGTAGKVESIPTTPRRAPEPQVTPKEEQPQTLKQPAKPTPPPQAADVPQVRNANVEMFMTSWCGYCRKAREYFQARGIAITEYDVEADAAAAQRKHEILPSPGVPLVVINGTPIQGYSPHAFDQALQER